MTTATVVSEKKSRLQTILIMTDSDAVRQRIATILRDVDFHVLQAASGPAALESAINYDGQIDLLISDFEGRGMSGPDLGAAMKKLQQNIQVMFVCTVFGGEGLLVLDYGWTYIESSSPPTVLVEIVNRAIRRIDETRDLSSSGRGNPE